MPGPIRIVDYDPCWPSLYEEEERRVLDAVGHKVIEIEHIGSTSVPGLGAKPIIDLMAGLQGPADAEECLPPLHDLGYTHVLPQPEEEDWYYCLGKGPHSVGYHLHLVKAGSAFWGRHILFRDYLRAHPETAQQYHELKKRLAASYREQRLEYNLAKTAFIESVIAEARKAL